MLQACMSEALDLTTDLPSDRLRAANSLIGENILLHLLLCVILRKKVLFGPSQLHLPKSSQSHLICGEVITTNGHIQTFCPGLCRVLPC